MLKSPSPSLLVVIVNYRTPQLTIDCLQSLQTEVKHHANTRVVVADNQSGDESVVVLRDAIASHHWQDWVTLQPLDRNGGFAAGNNAVVGPALQSTHPPDYIWLLNPDTVVHPGALKTLLTFLEQHPDVGIAGSRLENLDGTPQYSAFRFHTIWSELDQGLRLGLVSKVLSQWILAPPIADQAIATDWLAGASMMIRRQVFEQIGLLDDGFFMYYEEVDFCLRARQANWTCWYVPASRVVHLVGQSSGVTGAQATQQRRPQYWFDSRHRYFHKHHSHGYAVLTDLAWLGGYSLWQLRQLVQHKPQVDPPHLLQDFFCNSAFVKGGAMSQRDLSLWQQIREDWRAHQSDWTKPGFRAVAVHRFGVWRMQLQPKLLRAPFSLIYRGHYRYIRNVYGIDLPYTVKLGRRVVIEHQGAIVIHGDSEIGDESIIRQGVTLGNRYLDHPLDAPKLGARVNIGAGAKILGNVVLGDDVNIGANAVVLSDVHPGQTAVGIPAKILTSHTLPIPGGD